MLKDLEIESYPLILSTRNNGFVPSYPTVDGFNYLIAYAKVDGKTYLLDATQKSLSPGVLPKRCLNEKGLLIKEKGVEWIDLKTNQEYKVVTSIDAKLTEDGNLSGKLFYVKKGYAAIDLRNSLYDSKDKEEYFKDLEKNNAGIKITNKEFQNIDSIDLPTKEIYDFELNSKTQKNDDLIYFSPIVIDQMDENPFRIKERQYPVDYTYPIEDMYVVNLIIPQNYKVEEKPASVNLSLPNNNGKFTYMLNIVNDNTIQLNYKFSIKKTVFSQNEYIDLKEFYTQIIKKLNEQIVLKKI